MKFSKRIGNFLGRNGFYRASGIQAEMIYDNMVVIEPITTKNKIGRCQIWIPVEDIPELIMDLKRIYSEGVKSIDGKND